MMEGSLVGRARWVFLAAALAALGIAGTAVPAAIGAAPSEPPQASESSSAVMSWPGARGGPAGIRAWTPGTGSSWMHRVPEDGSPVSLTFGTLPPDAYSLPVADALDMAGIDVGGPHADQPERVADVRVQAWLMDLDGQMVVIMIKSLPDTPPGLVAEAESVVESVRIDADAGGPGARLLFDLPEGWDTG